jgi:ubiquinone/menaquinone biosynthesis C-methylase UbiE
MDFAEEAVPTWKEMGTDDCCLVASAEDIPFGNGTFDMVTCTDMLEHVPERSVRQVLSEMYRVGRRDFWFTVAMRPAKFKMPHDGSEPHVCLKPPEWWLEEMVRIGYRFHSVPFTANHTLIVEARKREAEPRRYKPLQ